MDFQIIYPFYVTTPNTQNTHKTKDGKTKEVKYQKLLVQTKMCACA